MNVSAGPPVEPLHDQQEKGSLASGAAAHRSTPGTIARVGRIDRRHLRRRDHFSFSLNQVAASEQSRATPRRA